MRELPMDEIAAANAVLDDNAPRPEYLAKVANARVDLQAEFRRILPARPAQLVWEVGCGHGHFLTAYAERHREVPCIGIDLLNERLVRATKKRDRAGLAHLHFIHADAQMFLEELPPGTTFSAVYVLFSDPWPKKRHHKNRIMQTRFLDEVARRAAPGMPLYFRTDHGGYFADTLEILRAHPDWHCVTGHPWPFELATVFQQRASSYQSLVALRR